MKGGEGHPYIGNRITPQYPNNLLKFYKNGKGTSLLAKSDVLFILSNAEKLLRTKRSLVKLQLKENTGITVVGDTHGQFFDLCHLFEINGLPSNTNKYLFNGDLVDRGLYGCEIVLTLLSYMLAYPNSVFIGKGNHETTRIQRDYGFYNEVLRKYDEETYQQFISTLKWLPLIHVINDSVFVVHGGIPHAPATLEDLSRLETGSDPVDGTVGSELLWNDPRSEDGFKPSFRGIGYFFGPNVVNEFLEDNNLDLIIRSHELKFEGYEWIVDNKCVTIFSAPNYLNSVGNAASFLRLKFVNKKPVYDIETFESVNGPREFLASKKDKPDFDNKNILTSFSEIIILALLTIATIIAL